MKLVTFVSPSGLAKLGAVVNDGEHIVDIAMAAAMLGMETSVFDSMLDLIQAGEEGLTKARQVIDNISNKKIEAALVSYKETSLLAPLTKPEQLRDFLCFERHLRQARQQRLKLVAAKQPDPEAALQKMIDAGQTVPAPIWYQQPIYYKGNRFSVVGPNADIEWPEYSQFMDYELEFAVVIGKKIKNATREQAREAIFGYMIFNDFSARDTQADEMLGQLGPAKSKDFDTANSFGPWLVTADEIADPYALQMEARVNGELWCSENTSTMYHKFEDIIVHVSKGETLYPGEVLGSGTIGNGSAFEIGKRLQIGDTIELSVTGLGTLSNRITRA